jgi:outer membrane murein-binding lipoprotein Lpp
MNTVHISIRAALLSLSLLAGGLAVAATAQSTATALPEVNITTDALANNVKSAIFNAVGRKSPDIMVVNRDGVISLSGWARTGADVSTAMYVARQLDGVKQVHNDGVRLWSTRMYDY